MIRREENKKKIRKEEKIDKLFGKNCSLKTLLSFVNLLITFLFIHFLYKKLNDYIYLIFIFFKAIKGAFSKVNQPTRRQN